MRLREVPVVILAAGLGKRLRPLTCTTPKPMLPIVGKPILERVLDSIREADFAKIVIVISPQHKKIRSYFKDGSNFGLSIQYVFQDKPLGMAHAVGQVKDLIEEDNFLLLASDNIVEAGSLQSMVKKHQRGDFAGTLSLMKNKWKDVRTLSSVKIDRHLHVQKIVEKPKPHEALSNTVSMPLYVFNKAIFQFLPKVKVSPRGEYEIQNAIQMMIDGGLVVSGFYIKHRLHLTSIEDLMEINSYFLERESLLVKSRGFDTYFPTTFHSTCEVGAGSEIGPYVYVGADSRLARNVKAVKSVIMSKVTIGKGSTLANCVLGTGVKVGEKCQIGDHKGSLTVIGDHSKIKCKTLVTSGTRLNPYSLI